MSKITKDMLIGDLVAQYPETAPMIAQSGMHCLGCHAAAGETLEQGCKAHGMDDKSIEKLVKELNKIVEKKLE